MRQHNVMTQTRTYADDVMTEERAVPVIGLAPMPRLASQRRLARKLVKRVTLAMPEKREAPKKKSKLYYELREAFTEVKLMMEGKLPKKSAFELLEELRAEKLKREQDEL